jgi:chromosome segregation ATPase
MSQMKFLTVFALLAASAVADETNPIAKVSGMLAKLQQDVVKEGEEAQSTYNEFAEMCEDRSGELHNEIKTGKAQVSELTATIEKAAADTAVFEEKISSYASTISEAEADLKEATGIRKKESSDFKAAEKELMQTINTISRAASIVQKEMNGGASLAQLSSQQNVVQALSAMVDAQGVGSADSANLMAMLQSSSKSEEDSDEDEVGAPSAASYKSQSGGIVDVLSGLQDKAEAELDDARKAESNALNSYQMQKQSLDDKIKFSNAELAEAKKSLASTAETSATATGALDVTKKDLAEDIKDLSALHHDCLSQATSFEEETKARGEELKALAEAKKIIEESTGGATSQTYLAQTSFLQLATQNSETSKAVNMVRHLARSMRSQALAQLATRMQSASRSSADPFGKVKGMIRSMIEKLADEAEADATKKAYCDKNMAESQQKVDDKTADIEKLTTQVDVMAAESKKLKGEVAVLQKELAALSKTQAEMDKLRADQKAIYEKNKPELELGVKGVKQALKVLREYYAKDQDDPSQGSATGIIGLLEVCESDFSKGLAEMIAEEEASVSAYEETTNENNIAKATKEQDAKYKTKEHVGLDKTITELKADKSGVIDELAAVNEAFGVIKKECIAKAEPYEEKVKRRNAEIAGLKDALQTLEQDASLLQRSAVHRHLRA